MVIMMFYSQKSNTGTTLAVCYFLKAQT